MMLKQSANLNTMNNTIPDRFSIEQDIQIILDRQIEQAEKQTEEYNQLCEEYNQLCEQYNQLCEQYNQLCEQYRQLTEQYNQVIDRLDRIEKNTTTIRQRQLEWTCDAHWI